LVGGIVAILIVGAIASIGYYQVEVAPGLNTTTTTSSISTTASCTRTSCFNISIISGASTCGAASGAAPCGFSPASITLVIGKNNTVVWKNNDPGSVHTATASDNSFNSHDMHEGDTFTFTFAVAGTYHYSCIYHPWMQGTIVVKSA
jgi:plastocyanin